MQNPELIPVNERQKYLWYFETQTNQLISARLLCRFHLFSQSENEKSDKRDKYLDLAKELKRNFGTWR